jgi:taurine dioxygenase
MKAYNRPRRSGKRPPLTENQMRAVPDVVHPVVRAHPFTRRKCLFVNEGYTTRIVGLAEEESNRLLAELLTHVTNPAFVYRHRWQAGDFLMWDNCSTQHCAIADYALPARRLMERTTLRGSIPQ